LALLTTEITTNVSIEIAAPRRSTHCHRRPDSFMGCHKKLVDGFGFQSSDKT
jgi:hypothetical protein